MGIILALLAADAGTKVPPKMTVFASVEPGQTLASAKMPALRNSYLCVIMKAQKPGRFVGVFAATGQPNIEVTGEATDLYECKPNTFKPGSEVWLVSKVHLDGPVAVSAQVQVTPGR